MKRTMAGPSELDNLRRDVFFKLMELAGRVYIQVRYSGSASIGRRDFSDDEKKHGLVLVINQSMKFQWDDDGLSASLLFGSVAEKCYIPVRDIIAVYSPDLGVQYATVPPVEAVEERPKAKDGDETQPVTDDNVIKVDFTKRKK